MINPYSCCSSCHHYPCSCNIFYNQGSCTPSCTGCDSQIQDYCVFYTGAYLPCLGITTGATLNTALQAIDSKLCISAPSGYVVTAKISLTSAQILNLYTTPIQLIPSPGVGNFINVLSITASLIYNTLTYTTNTTMSIYFPGSSGSLSNNSLLASSASSVVISTINGTLLGGAPLFVSVNDGNPLVGDGVVNLYITYIISTL